MATDENPKQEPTLQTESPASQQPSTASYGTEIVKKSLEPTATNSYGTEIICNGMED